MFTLTFLLPLVTPWTVASPVQSRSRPAQVPLRLLQDQDGDITDARNEEMIALMNRYAPVIMLS